MRKSLRLRLQFWHGLILLLVVSGFGSALYAEVRRARLVEIDAELLTRAHMIDRDLRPKFPRGLPPGKLAERFPVEGPPFRRDGPGPPVALERHRPGGPPGPPPGLRGEERNPPGRPPLRHDMDHRRPPEPVRLSPSQGPPELSYFVVWLPSGSLFDSDLDPKILGMKPGLPAAGRPMAWWDGDRREIAIRGPGETTILVGRRAGTLRADLNRLARQLATVGLSVFLVGLIGGGWLSNRAVHPIEAMGKTAAGINASNLSQRIDLLGVDQEFERLGSTLNEMLDRLESAFHRQVRFTADASHELRTPLTVILTHAELALSRPRSADDYKETIGTCRRAADRMKSLVEDLLTLARADVGRLDLKMRIVDLRHLVDESSAPLAPVAHARDLRIKVSGDTVRVPVDPARISQVITNLLTNAITYNRPGGSVILSTRQEGEFGVIQVADTGQGVPEADRSHLFDRFYRVDLARSRETGGSGLGLAISQSIVEAHGGSLTFTSVEGTGTTFEVRLPRHPKSAPIPEIGTNPDQS